MCDVLMTNAVHVSCVTFGHVRYGLVELGIVVMIKCNYLVKITVPMCTVL